MKTSLKIRAAANALNLSTATGLLLAALTGTRVARGPDGLFIGSSYTPRLPLAGAFTVGNVVLCRGGPGALEQHPGLLAHESGHASQYAWCLGLPFLPLYGACAAWSLWRTGDPGSRNFFERNAGLERGGYRELPTVDRGPAVRNFLQRLSFFRQHRTAAADTPPAAPTTEGNHP
ncbi:hypothetical protein [Arthrobacter sp. HY1533]|uniref:hypothetical protein n=1 Tax=Arthrobacter sp. HY1533 TaxID=2970919 RepID=UPI0022B9F99C|nr:hypothetical protein [Arthrobacter sp. HY1533]